MFRFREHIFGLGQLLIGAGEKKGQKFILISPAKNWGGPGIPRTFVLEKKVDGYKPKRNDTVLTFTSKDSVDHLIETLQAISDSYNEI